MCCESRYFLHFGIFPNINLIERVSMSRDKLIECFTEDQIANLRACVYGASSCSFKSISELDGFVSSSSSRQKKSMLVRRPSYCLHSSNVITVFCHWLLWLHIPNVQFIVISSWTQLLLIRRPFQTTYLLFMMS